MSGIVCTCDNNQVKHLNVANCNPQLGVLKRLVLVPLFKEDGTLNKINTNSGGDAIGTSAFWDGLQYNTDPQERYFPLAADMKNLESNKADVVYEEFNDGSKSFVRDGVRSFTFMLIDNQPALIGKINSKRCAKHGAFFVDSNGALVGIEKEPGYLYPMPIKDNTLNAYFGFTTDTTVQKIMVAFDLDDKVLDEQISFIPAADIAVDLFTQFNGKLDTNMVQVGAGTTTGFTVKITNDFGTANRKIPVTGLVTADFALFNDTDNASVTITSVTESSTDPGVYVFVVPSQTATDNATLSLSSSTASKPFDDGTWANVVISFD